MDHLAVTKAPLPGRARRRCAFLLLAIATGLLPAPSIAGLGQPREAEFVETPELPFTFEQAWKVTLLAMESYRIRRSDPVTGQILSEPVFEEVRPNRYRTTVLAVVQRRGERSAVSVRAQREIEMESLSPGVFSGSSKWQKVGSNRKIADAVVASILKSAGMEPPPPPASSPSTTTPASPAAPLPASWDEIQGLKAERNRLMAPIRDLDRRALEILYSPDAASRSQELEAVRAERLRRWEEIKAKVMEIDQKILELALQE